MSDEPKSLVRQDPIWGDRYVPWQNKPGPGDHSQLIHSLKMFGASMAIMTGSVALMASFGAHIAHWLVLLFCPAALVLLMGRATFRTSRFRVREQRMIRRHARRILDFLRADEAIHHYCVAREAPPFGYSLFRGWFHRMKLERRELYVLVTDRRVLALRPSHWPWGRMKVLHSISRETMAAVRFEPSRALFASKNRGVLKSNDESIVTIEIHGRDGVGFGVNDEPEGRALADATLRLRSGGESAGAGALSVETANESQGALSPAGAEQGLSLPEPED